VKQRLCLSFTTKEVRSTREARDWKERRAFEHVQINGVKINVKCPNCGETSEKLVYADELKDELTGALCNQCKRFRPIKVPEVVTELRSLLQ
jgi:hypothetical protein